MVLQHATEGGRSTTMKISKNRDAIDSEQFSRSPHPGIREPKGRVKGWRVEYRPSRSPKLWLGTFSTLEKAKRAYDAALYLKGKGVYYYVYPDNYFPERQVKQEDQVVINIAKLYAEKTDVFLVNKGSLKLGSAAGPVTAEGNNLCVLPDTSGVSATLPGSRCPPFSKVDNSAEWNLKDALAVHTPECNTAILSYDYYDSHDDSYIGSNIKTFDETDPSLSQLNLLWDENKQEDTLPQTTHADPTTAATEEQQDSFVKMVRDACMNGIMFSRDCSQSPLSVIWPTPKLDNFEDIKDEDLVQGLPELNDWDRVFIDDFIKEAPAPTRLKVFSPIDDEECFYSPPSSPVHDSKRSRTSYDTAGYV